MKLNRKLGSGATALQVFTEMREFATFTAAVLPALIKCTAFDLRNGKLSSFAAYRFLYERLFGAAVRPWLASAFGAAATLPCIHPELRGALMRSLGDVDLEARGWSNREPTFIPQWIEKVPLSLI